MLLKIIKFLFFSLIVAVVTGGFLAWHQYEQFANEPVNIAEEGMTFTIPAGSNIAKVAKSLEDQNVINSAVHFKWLARLSEKANQIKAGEFQLDHGMTPNDLLNRFVSGKTIQYQFSLIEGFTYKDLVKKVKASPVLVQTLSDDDYKNIMQVIGSDELNPEGWFFPDTYSFPKNTTDLDFLKRAHQQMKAFLQKEWENREPNKYITTPYEALTLASIVEKETGIPEERPLIAGVFLNRLRKGMMLQTDPTVIYGMGERYKGNIRKSDLRRDTPYNTYTRTGLTPTPIATPSADAIKAVMHPDKTEAFYFVAKGGGAHHFSKTYAEHRRAVVKYLLNGNASRYKGDK
jgi:UPF0755 protein